MIETFGRLGLVLGLGLLIGLQRERTDARLAGFRTFPLVGLLGALCGLAGETLGGWVIGGGFAALAAVIVGGRLSARPVENDHPGITSEVALLLMFALGAYLMVGTVAVAVAACGAVFVLLQLKPQLHDLAGRIEDREFKAIFQFALITLVVLPVLPDRSYGPYDVLNPFKIWLLVVLIVGISLGGYIAYRLIGARAGAWAAGALGGLISSTATTMSLSRQCRRAVETPEIGAFVIIVASAVVFLRVGVLIGATAPAFLVPAALPLATIFAALVIGALVSLPRRGQNPTRVPVHENPTELKPALLFGLFFAVVLLGVAAAKDIVGQRGLYFTAALAGLGDMDAITLSITRLVAREEIAAEAGWRSIVVAALANIAFKTGIVAFTGGSALLRRIAPTFFISALAGAAWLAFGPI